MQNTLNILIIDDDRVDRQNIKRILKQTNRGFKVTECEDVESGLKVVETNNHNCILIDYRMPASNGLDGIKKIHSTSPYTPIIMITGQGDEILAVKAMETGAQYYIPKDRLTADFLLNTINAAIERETLRKKIDEQQAELENFGRLLAHDLKAPIRQISGYVDFIVDSIKEKKYEKVEKYHSSVEKLSNQINILIDTLWKYTTLESEKITLEDVNMEQIVKDAINNLGHEIKEKKATITFDKFPEIKGNQPQLIQLLQNLIGNALKYCEDRTPHIHITSTETNNAWQFAVKDNGVGIKEKNLKTIFEPFKRVHKPGNYPGAGLGLATCQKIINRHNGNIWCESTLGEGTTFLFTLPKTI